MNQSVPPARSEPASPALKLDSLGKRFGARTALEAIDLVAPRGELLALLGPNGAGKTTTVEICAGAARPDSGTVRVLGCDPHRHAARLRPRIGVMPQGGGAYPGVHAAEMLELVARCAARPLEVGWLLDVLGLSGCRRVPFKRLSGGQQQRLSLACAIVGRPELVFLDEPTAGMDPQGRTLVWELLSALRADGVTVVLTTHLMDEAEALADRVVIIDQGRVVADGSPRALRRPDAACGQVRFRARSGLDTSLLAEALPEGYLVRELTPGSYRVDGDVDPQVVSTVTTWCAQHGVLAEQLHVGARDLEEVFLELTGRELRS